ncbi:unnamed protein product [Allacma fusca]|uniref:Acyltransferase n=1 Tax=Allacma fusca TaxID=39272 RepID=A0A8J2NYQ5_9HEXA|nr:unnamed protein product [Allacma fusca]
MSAQTNAWIVMFILLFILGPAPISPCVMLYILFFTNYYPWVIAYILWCIYDRETKTRIKRRSEWLRRLPVWNYFRDYYPSQFVKTADLDPSKNYVFCLHPHGVVVAGSLNFSTEAGRFSEKFPGIKPFVLVHELLILFSPIRELAIPLGLSSVTQSSFEYLLTERDGGNGVVIVPGGVREQITTKHGPKIELVLKNRKGFAREALKYGASLVPVFTFGEHELYKHAEFPPDGWFFKLQQGLKDYLGIPLLNITGRYQILPLKKPLTTVVGEPIHCERNCKPSQSEIDEHHSKYINSLILLFETHKETYGKKNHVLQLI